MNYATGTHNLIQIVSGGALGCGATTLNPCTTTGHGLPFFAMGYGGTPPLTYSWNFGDGSPVVYIQNVTHAYMSPGIYTVTSTVTDSQSNVATDQLLVYVEPIE
jgi:hypothetical protein